MISEITTSHRSHINEWATSNEWPKEFFERDKPPDVVPKKESSTVSLRRIPRKSTLVTSTLQGDENVVPYDSPRYELVLERDAGCYMGKYAPGVTEANERLCRSLLDPNPVIPEDLIFQDTFQGSYDTVATESFKQSWNRSYPITKPFPRPDYGAGFKQSAFSDAQLKRLQPFLGDLSSPSYFLGTARMHFPFYSCEVGSGPGAIDIADRQNLHSMTVAVRGVVQLFQLVNRVEELHRQILGFSVSHVDEIVRIYGHFPVIEEDKITYWRHSLRKYTLTEQDDMEIEQDDTEIEQDDTEIEQDDMEIERDDTETVQNDTETEQNDTETEQKEDMENGAGYTLLKNVYNIWMPAHFRRIISAIDDLPSNDDCVLPGSEPQIPRRPRRPLRFTANLQIWDRGRQCGTQGVMMA
jgi:hypothetical protein